MGRSKTQIRLAAKLLSGSTPDKIEHSIITPVNHSAPKIGRTKLAYSRLAQIRKIPQDFDSTGMNIVQPMSEKIAPGEASVRIARIGNVARFVQRQQAATKPKKGITLAPVREVRDFIESTIRFWRASKDYLSERKINRALLDTLLRSWLKMVDNGWRLIETRLKGDPKLLSRLQTTYSEVVSALISQASDDMGVTQQNLYQQHNAQIAWWVRKRLYPRENIVFILGGRDSFYTSATRYFRFKAVNFISDLRSLVEVRDWLNANRPINGLPWGDVNIVAHANVEGQMKTPILRGGKRVTVDSLRQAINDQTFRTLPDEVVDNATRLIIRGCALGRRQEILEVLRTAFGGNQESPQVYAPVHLQAYSYKYRKSKGRKLTTSAKEYFKEFWYVGYPAKPIPRRNALVRMFKRKHPREQVNWLKLLKNKRSRKKQTYTMPYTFEETNWAPPPTKKGRIILAQLVRASSPQSQSWKRIRETGRKTATDSTISIIFNYRHAGKTFHGGVLPGLIPRVKNQKGYRRLLSLQPDLMAVIRELEEKSNLNASDFYWIRKLQKVGKYTFNFNFKGRRTLLRVHRNLMEPIPGKPGKKRQVKPDISKPGHYGRELPSNY